MNTTDKAIKNQKVIRLLDEMERFNITVEDLLGYKGKVADVWSIEDLDNMFEWKGMSFEPALTRDEKFSILQAATDRHNYNAEEGINYDVLEGWTERLFGNRLVQD